MLRLLHDLITCSWRETVPVLVPWRDLCEVPPVSMAHTLRPAGPQQLCQTTTETSLEHGAKFHPMHKLGVLPPTAILVLCSPGNSPVNPNPIKKMSSSRLCLLTPGAAAWLQRPKGRTSILAQAKQCFLWRICEGLWSARSAAPAGWSQPWAHGSTASPEQPWQGSADLHQLRSHAFETPFFENIIKCFQAGVSRALQLQKPHGQPAKNPSAVLQFHRNLWTFLKWKIFW